MSYYNVCARCGANLDPGEHCDCSAAVSFRHIPPSKPMRAAGRNNPCLQAAPIPYHTRTTAAVRR